MNFLAAFLLGLAGSLHCAVMCGPLVLAVNAARKRNAVVPVGFYRGNLWPNLVYHGGRIATYCILGAISGLIGAGVVFAGFQRWLSIAAGSLILLATLTSFGGRWNGLAGKFIFAVKAKFGPLLHHPSVAATALLGGLNGLLPCGMVYIACAAAAASGGIKTGAAAMLAFGLGTAPTMLSIGLLGKLVRWNNPLLLRRVLLTCTTLVGILLVVRGLSLGIPYLSPHFSGGLNPTCHCHHAM